MLKSWITYVIVLILSALLNRIKPGYITSISFYVLLVLPLVSLIHVLLTYQAFKLIHNVDRRQVSKGDSIIYRIRLINPLPILMAPFSLHFYNSNKLFQDAKFEDEKRILVEERRRVDIQRSLKCNYRGNYAIGVDCIYIKDYFGLFRVRYTEIEQHKILVYPKLRELKSNLLRNVVNESSESIVSMDAANQSVFSDIREYQPGDPLNRIHWKLSAKANTLLSKDYSGQMTNKTVVLLDTYNLGLENEDGIIFEDYLVEGCVSLVHFLLESRVHTTLYYEHHGINAVESSVSSDFSIFYDELANIKYYNENNFLSLVNYVIKNEQDACHIVVMSQQLTPELSNILIKLSYLNYEVSVIVVDSNYIELEDLDKHVDNQSMFLLTTSRIPVYHLQHDEMTTKLEVS